MGENWNVFKTLNILSSNHIFYFLYSLTSKTFISIDFLSLSGSYSGKLSGNSLYGRLILPSFINLSEPSELKIKQQVHRKVKEIITSIKNIYANLPEIKIPQLKKDEEERNFGEKIKRMPKA